MLVLTCLPKIERTIDGQKMKIVKKNEKKVTYVLSCRLNMKVIGWFHLDHYKVPLSLVTVDFL